MRSITSKARLVAAGHELHVITYREVGTEEVVRKQLQALGIRYTDIHLPLEPCRPPEWKVKLVKQLGVELMIEDSPEVLSQIPPGVQRLWVCDPEVFDLGVCVRALNESS